MCPEETPDGSIRQARFATTQWSVVVEAGRGGGSPESHRALANLCEAYWYPLYAFARRSGSQPVEAQDLTQAFFTQLLEKDRLRMAHRERGRFRSFLLASFRNFLANESRRRRTQKRGGGRVPWSLDFAAAESRYVAEPSHELTPERVYERRWAMTLLDNALTRLRDEYARTDRLFLFDRFKDYLGRGPDTPPYKELAQQLGMSEGAIKVAVHRFRKRCREVLRAEIAETVSSPEHVDEELRSLFVALES